MGNRHLVNAASFVCVGLGAVLTATTAQAAKPGGGPADACVGAVPSFVFNRAVSGSARKDIYLANETATCTRFLFSVTAGNYMRALSFRVVEQPGGGSQGRVVATDGLNVLRLVRFNIGDNMMVSGLENDVVFEPSQPGFIDEGFDIAADGRKLVYMTADETAASDAVITPADSLVFRVRILPDVDTCADAATPCAYSAGTLVAERIGSSNRLEFPRWNVAGSAVFVVDYQGDLWRPDISRIGLSPGESPEVKVSRSLGRELTLFQVRPDPVNTEVVVYGGKPLVGPNGSNCRDLRVIRSSDGLRLNSDTSLLVVGAAQQSADGTSRQLLVDGAKESRNGVCSGTGTILRAIDNGISVQSIALTSGYRPATP